MSTSNERMVLAALKLRAQLGFFGADLFDEDMLSIGWSNTVWNPQTRSYDTSTDGSYYVTLDCSDTFAWACADSEPITEETWDVLLVTIDDIRPYWDQARATHEQAKERDRLARSTSYDTYVSEHPDRGDLDHWDLHGNPTRYHAPERERGTDPAALARSLGDLYAARVRRMRPQGACYSSYPKGLWPAFDACGDERAVDRDNPFAAGDYRTSATNQK